MVSSSVKGKSYSFRQKQWIISGVMLFAKPKPKIILEKSSQISSTFKAELHQD